MTHIDFGGHAMVLDPSGVLIWPDRAMAIVSDLHLEKGSHFAMRGFFIPPYDSHETLMRLIAACAFYDVKRLLLLGDCFHDPHGYHRMDAATQQDFKDLQRLDPIWIKGNHDRDFVPPGFASYDAYEEDGITFRHEAIPGEINEISGHFHPKARIVHKGAVIDRPCFLSDGFKLLMPAFGAYTGGLLIDDPAIRNLVRDDARFHMLGTDRIYSFPLKKQSAD